MEIIINSVVKALIAAFTMFWEVLWPLTLGFALSAVIQAVVSKKTMAKALGTDSPKSITLATLYGMASSSCSYAAVAIARSIFKKGGSFASAMVFEIASTNLVIELGIILIILMGWQFAAAEFIGGIVMVIILSVIFRLTLTKRLVNTALHHAKMGLVGQMEGHADMDMSVKSGSFWSKLLSRDGFTAVSHYFVMDWISIWKDLAIGFLLAGVLAAWIPNSWWQTLFLSSNPTLAAIEGPLIGPVIAIISFVCSVGNVPLAAVFWRGGISYGGVISFIFADLIAIQILDIYRKYYSLKVSLYILATFYAAMAMAGYIVEFLFGFLGLTPKEHTVGALTEGIQWNYTSMLNIVFLVFGAIMLWRFIKTGGVMMMRMMNEPAVKMNH